MMKREMNIRDLPSHCKCGGRRAAGLCCGDTAELDRQADLRHAASGDAVRPRCQRSLSQYQPVHSSRDTVDRGQIAVFGLAPVTAITGPGRSRTQLSYLLPAGCRIGCVS